MERKDYNKLEEFFQDIKMKLKVKAQRLRRYKKCQQQFYQNKLFRDDTKKFYQLLNKQHDGIPKLPS